MMKQQRYAKVPTILQMEATECGAASLAMIFAYWGKHVTLEKMRIETDVNRDGVNAKSMAQAAKRNGFECHVYSKPLQKMLELPVPSIIHWEFSHFVVFEGVKGKYAYLNDPAMGRRKLTLQELEEGFTGVVFDLKPGSGFVPEKRKRGKLRPVFSRLKGNAGVLLKLFYAGLLLVFPGIVLSVLSQVFMDDVLGNGYTDWLTRLLVFMGCALTLKLGLSYYRSLLLQKFKSVLILTSARSFLERLFRLPISFFDQRYAGELVNRVDNDVEISGFLAGDLTRTVLNMITAVFYFVILFLYDPFMSFIGLADIGLCLLSVFVSGKAVANAAIKLKMSDGKLSGAVGAGLSVVDTIKASGVEKNYSNRILGYQAEAATQEQRLKHFQQIVGVLPDVIDKIADVLLLLVGGYMVIYGKMTMGMLVAFTSMFDMFCQPVNELAGFFSSLQEMKASISREMDILDYPIPPKPLPAANAPMKKLNGKLELQSITFGYSRQKSALINRLSITVNPGESFAFVGASGCGKSTLGKLISGLYAPWSGEILFDGQPRHAFPSKVMHSSVAIVDQNIRLFSGTVRDNITLYNPLILDRDVIRALQDACIYDLISSLPGGLDYRLEENATNLSGGQRQRLEIARALACEPSVLILDEATSALDPVTEKKVMDNIQKRGCTCIIIAHRLSTIRYCKQIAFLQNGTIVQLGNHDTLLSQEGPYRHFVQSA